MSKFLSFTEAWYAAATYSERIGHVDWRKDVYIKWTGSNLVEVDEFDESIEVIEHYMLYHYLFDMSAHWIILKDPSLEIINSATNI